MINPQWLELHMSRTNIYIHVLPKMIELFRIDPRRIGNILSWRSAHEIFSAVILSLPLIEEGQLSVSGERMCTILVNRLAHYENRPVQIYWKFHHQKLKNFQIKTPIFFHISAQNIDCRYSLEPPRQGGSNEYPQSMFLSRYKKNNVYPCKPQFYYIKVGFKGVKIIQACFRDDTKPTQ